MGKFRREGDGLGKREDSIKKGKRSFFFLYFDYFVVVKEENLGSFFLVVDYLWKMGLKWFRRGLVVKGSVERFIIYILVFRFFIF